MQDITFKRPYTWPNPHFPFRIYLDDPRCRIFIIENIQHNWDWLSVYYRNFRENDFFFVYCGWFHSPQFAEEAARVFKTLGLRKSKFFFLFNSPEEERNCKSHGFIGEVINHNAWLDETSTMHILPETSKFYDAIYVARRSKFKRHMLASKVPRLALVAGNNHGNDVEPVPPFSYINDLPLSPDEVCIKMNQAYCGLILSEIEGACFSSSEYLLCGIPVVSTQSKGGRDVWYNDYNSIVCEADPEAVASAVQELKQNPRDPNRIRQDHISMARVYREKFIYQLSVVFEEFNLKDINPSVYFNENFIHKMRKSIKPDFESIFGKQ